MKTTKEVCEQYGVPYITLIKWIERGVYLGAAFHKRGRFWKADERLLKSCSMPDNEERELHDHIIKIKVTGAQYKKAKLEAGPVPLSVYFRRRFFEHI